VPAETYRHVMQTWPSGVTVITIATADKRHGMTASAFTSVSIDPPMVLVVVDRRWRSHDLIVGARAFCVNILAEDQADVADRFAGRHGDMADRFFDLAVHPGATRSPILEAALAHLDCVLHAAHDAGDHSIFVGRVVGGAVHRPDARPLLYHAQGYARLEPSPRA
jgi:flavin reductase (DIM6/NTAB) family NADH-FMN oxidoreductase RutF